MNKKILVSLVALPFLILGISLLLITLISPASTAQDKNVLSEEHLREIAFEAARLYGLKSEPKVLVSQYLLAREWGPFMTRSDIHRQPDTMVYGISLEGEFEPGLTGGFAVPDLPDTFAPKGYTFGINAYSGLIMFELSEPVDDLHSLTTDSERALYGIMSRQEWAPLTTIVPFDDPRNLLPESTEEPLN